MAWIPFYIVKEDLDFLSNWLKGERDIALIKSVGPGAWKATFDYSISESGSYCLYHTQSGSLPLVRASLDEDDGVIADPFQGWIEERKCAEPDKPFFGAGHQGVYWLEIKLLSKGVIGMSGFEWIGNHYARLDGPAPECTKKWWARLTRWVKKNTEKVQRQGELKGDKDEIFTFPYAYQNMLTGVNRALNP